MSDQNKIDQTNSEVMDDIKKLLKEIKNNLRKMKEEVLASEARVKARNEFL